MAIFQEKSGGKGAEFAEYLNRRDKLVCSEIPFNSDIH